MTIDVERAQAATEAAFARAWARARARLDEAFEAEHDRLFLWVPVFSGLGIGIYFALAFEPHPALAAACVVAGGGLLTALRRGAMSKTASIALLACACGFAAAVIRSHWVAEPVLASEMSSARVAGWIELIEPQGARGQRLTVRIASIESLAREETPYRVRVRNPAVSGTLRVGDAVRFRARLGPPPPPTLPGDYDFARRAWFVSIGAVGFVTSRIETVEGAPPPPTAIGLRSHLEGVRARINERIREALPGPRGAIAMALITGDQGAIDPADLNALRNSGLAHILSVSGLHMAIMAGALFWSLRLLLAAVPAIALRFPVKKWAAAAGIAGAYGYFLISGAAVATERSFIMIALMLLSVILDRPALSLRNVALAGLAILAYKPESLLDVSFQMSFSATIALIAAYEVIAERRRRRLEGGPEGALAKVLAGLAASALTTLIAGTASSPFAIATFHSNAQYGLIANMASLPVMTFLVMPGVLLALLLIPLGLESAPLQLMGLGIDLTMAVARWTASLPGAVWLIPAIPEATLWLFTLGGLWLVIWRLAWRWLGLIPIAAGIAVAPLHPVPDVLISRDGRTVAIRLADGRLSALAARKASFDLARWLEFDADRRRPSEVASGQGFQCDWSGCSGTVKGLTIAIAEHPAARADDCVRAAIVIARFPMSGRCPSARVVIDARLTKERGAHVLYLKPGGIETRSVAEARGRRPWSDAALAARRTRSDVSPSGPFNERPDDPQQKRAPPPRAALERESPPEGWTTDDLQ